MQRRPVRINDDALRDNLSRLDTYTKMLERRIRELDAAFNSDSAREETTLAVLEAEVAVGLVKSAAYEVSLRLLPHGVVRDAAKDIAPRLSQYQAALGRYEQTFGPIPRA
jgi:hypothetical protein